MSFLGEPGQKQMGSAGLDGCCSICRGHLFFQKATYTYDQEEFPGCVPGLVEMGGGLPKKDNAPVFEGSEGSSKI